MSEKMVVCKHVCSIMMAESVLKSKLGKGPEEELLRSYAAKEFGKSCETYLNNIEKGIPGRDENTEILIVKKLMTHLEDSWSIFSAFCPYSCQAEHLRDE